ncbi:MAG: cob(I)yrinic acid a,c-diamide adenosyltransferase [Bacteroidales bacterium]|nr:cob(I)yrinic acid a,c-diamide adenosyltransferase [Bacteroidales bacterium]
MKIYTKTGDNGSSGLIGGTRVSKDDIRLDAYGSIDELNAFMSVLLTEDLEQNDHDFLRNLQHQLFKIGSYLATDQSATELKFPEPVTEEMLQTIESEIDNITSILPEIHQFIIPGGNRTASLCHVCRTVCRRAERQVIKASKLYNVDNKIISYINRLSDYYFILGRKCCIKDSSEVFWDNTK